MSISLHCCEVALVGGGVGVKAVVKQMLLKCCCETLKNGKDIFPHFDFAHCNNMR